MSLVTTHSTTLRDEDEGDEESGTQHMRRLVIESSEDDNKHAGQISACHRLMMNLVTRAPGAISHESQALQERQPQGHIFGLAEGEILM